MALELVGGSNKGGPKPPKNNLKPSRREMLIGTAAAAGGMGVEATFKPLRSLYRLLLGDSEQDDFPDRQVLDELEARRQNATGEPAAIIDDTNDQALDIATTDEKEFTVPEETFDERMARMEREQKAELEAKIEAGINEHIRPEKIAELEGRLKAIPKYLEDLQLRFKPDGKLEETDREKIRAFLAETLQCKPEELEFNQYETDETQGVEKNVYINLKEELVALIDVDAHSDGNIEFALMKRDLATGLRTLRIEIDTEGNIVRYNHQLGHDGKDEEYDHRSSDHRTQYTATDVRGRDANQLLEKISLNYDSTGKAERATRQTSADGNGYEYYYRDRAAYDKAHKK